MEGPVIIQGVFSTHALHRQSKRIQNKSHQLLYLAPRVPSVAESSPALSLFLQASACSAVMPCELLTISVCGSPLDSLCYFSL